MVFKVIASNADNLDNPVDRYGFFDDTVLILQPATAAVFKTYEGNDYVFAGRLASGASTSVLLGSGNDTYSGGFANETVHDGSGNDRIILADGIDSLIAGAGNDTCSGGGGLDTIFFNFKTDDGYGFIGGNVSPVVIDLQVTTAQNLGAFGIDTISGFENAVMGSGGDRVLGTTGANSLTGLGGNDTLEGRGGLDTLEGGAGADRIVGGAVGDILYGAGGNTLNNIDNARDTFVYTAFSDSVLASADIIAYFDAGAAATDDRIDLSALDASVAIAGNQAFVWRGGAAFTTSTQGEVRISTSGVRTTIFIDNDADIDAEMVIVVEEPIGAISRADFIL